MNATRKHVSRGGTLAALAGLMFGGFAAAAPVPVKVELDALRCIQNWDVDMKQDDAVYLTVTGVAKGAETAARLPESGTMAANSKVQPIDSKLPRLFKPVGRRLDGPAPFAVPRKIGRMGPSTHPPFARPPFA